MIEFLKMLKNLQGRPCHLLHYKLVFNKSAYIQCVFYLIYIFRAISIVACWMYLVDNSRNYYTVKNQLIIKEWPLKTNEQYTSSYNTMRRQITDKNLPERISLTYSDLRKELLEVIMNKSMKVVLRTTLLASLYLYLLYLISFVAWQTYSPVRFRSTCTATG